jgi:isoprenylcysteine carboxyl methyltransferase (ICMT) family protein YpbQ
VAGEIASVAAIVWAPITGVLTSIGFGWLMIARIRIEDKALGRGAK